jgi:hypothetical protein
MERRAMTRRTMTRRVMDLRMTRRVIDRPTPVRHARAIGPAVQAIAPIEGRRVAPCFIHVRSSRQAERTRPTC